ncbi:hypothetical protein BgiBS90_015807, partial [Biomphalaria glabrata]
MSVVFCFFYFVTTDPTHILNKSDISKIGSSQKYKCKERIGPSLSVTFINEDQESHALTTNGVSGSGKEITSSQVHTKTINKAVSNKDHFSQVHTETISKQVLFNK